MKLVRLCSILYKLQSGSLIQLVDKRFNTGLTRHSEISNSFISHVLYFFSEKRNRFSVYKTGVEIVGPRP